MSFQAPINIASALDNIERQVYLLPAIQREFEWSRDKIEWLFDSLMRGYPISSFLFWNVENKSKPSYKFYKFLRVYRERYGTHNEDASVEGAGNFQAVLDGQQRLTSLYIGLKGSYAYKAPRLNWGNTEKSVPTRHLYLNISRHLEDQEDDRIYEFSFLKDSDTKKADLHEQAWFRVGKILDLKNIATFNNYVREQGLSDFGMTMLGRLQEVVFTDRVINFFLETEQDLHKALNIFIRMNNGGKKLEYPDLIMSIAVANWTKLDARAEIHGLVDRIQETGFTIVKDFVLKTYLYLHSRDIKFKVTNFTSDNAHYFEQNWAQIRDAIQSAFELIRSFGYNDSTLTSKNVVLPVIYYLYHRDVYRRFNTSVQYRGDRESIQKWLHVILLKRTLGTGGADGTLSQIRRAFTEDVGSDVKIKTDIQTFPAAAINSQIKRDMSVGPEFVERLLHTQKDDLYAFSILALLYPHLDYRNNDFHKDHLHPFSAFSAKEIEKLNLDETSKRLFLAPEWFNSIVNLQMLDSNENKAKQDKSLDDWVKAEIKRKDRVTFLDTHLIPDQASLGFKDFAKFAEQRKALLAKKLLEILK